MGSISLIQVSVVICQLGIPLRARSYKNRYQVTVGIYVAQQRPLRKLSSLACSLFPAGLQVFTREGNSPTLVPM
ncbi:hypothetical protein HD806DRAFT_347591 [Xylariaceae sp. AK1471]|nr:hypothetical protein HD806DRAFT_347591 [Xylariaceae sp. AK1471]